MVNRGRSTGCGTCKERRVKRDEAKPKCQACQRLQLRCSGYRARSRRIRFKSPNYRLPRQESLAKRVPFPLPGPDPAVPFFFACYASIGRNIASARGFFETLVAVYRSQQHGSALSLAVTAVASVILSLWRHDSRSFQWSRQSYTAAIGSIRSMLQSNIEQQKPTTTLAVLALQFYENIVAVYGYNFPTPIHLNGAVSLLSITPIDNGNSTMIAYLRKYILHIEISSALRQKRPLQSIAYSLLESSEPTAGTPNLSMALDAIGASVAEFQTACLQVVRHDNIPPQGPQECERVAGAQRLDAELLAWARSVPNHLQPRKLTYRQGIDSSIPTYHSVCEVYSSCQVASVWNLWLSQRLILVKIALDSLNAILHEGQSELMQNQISAAEKDFISHQERLQRLVDSVCYSVPFYLGNRTTLSSLADFTDSSILFPSYHPHISWNSECPCQHEHDAEATQRDEYRHHIIAKGPWHAMSPLSHLLTLLSDDHGSLMASFLRPGQLEWIQKQFIRVIILLGLPLDAGVNQWREREQLLQPAAYGSVDLKANYLAKEIRKATMFMSGL